MEVASSMIATSAIFICTILNICKNVRNATIMNKNLYKILFLKYPVSNKINDVKMLHIEPWNVKKQLLAIFFMFIMFWLIKLNYMIFLIHDLLFLKYQIKVVINIKFLCCFFPSFILWNIDIFHITYYIKWNWNQH